MHFQINLTNFHKKIDIIIPNLYSKKKKLHLDKYFLFKLI